LSFLLIPPTTALSCDSILDRKETLSQGERRLAAIMYTDMVGYTALGQRDESLSLAMVEAQQKVLAPVLTRHNGRVVKTMGDAFLVEFTNALEAARCAYDVQRSVKEFNLALSSEKRIHLRVGIHLGDVVEKEGDIFGDAVNVASRIEPLAEDGGVCLTQQVYDQVKNKLDVPLVSKGKMSLKNVSEPVEVYRMVMPWSEEKATPPTQLDKKRIAVLPFANMSPDPADEYFADGLTEELIDRLCQIRELEVIARTSTMSYKKKEKKAVEIAKELKVGSLVEGSVRKAGNKVRVTAQLIDGATEGHLWSSRYDKSLDDVFAVQSDIAEQVTNALRIHLLPNEKEAIKKKATESPEAYVLYLKGRYYWNERSPASVKRAMGYFESALERDPAFALALVGLADCYLILTDQFVLEPNETRPKVRSLLDKALKLDDGLAEAHASLGNLLQDEWNWPGAEAEYKRAIELNSNYATTYHWYSLMLAGIGRAEQALDEINRALRLDPVSPMVRTNVGLRLAEAGRVEEGIEQLLNTLVMEPDFGMAHGNLGAIYASVARYDEGITEMQKAVELLAGNPWPKALLGYAYGLKGDKTKACDLLRELEEASKSGFVPGALLGTIYFAVGEKEKALSLIQKAYEERSIALRYLSELTVYWQIRADPRFNAILARMLTHAHT